MSNEIRSGWNKGGGDVGVPTKQMEVWSIWAGPTTNSPENTKTLK